MRSTLRRLFGSPQAATHAPIIDPALGTLVFDRDLSCWTATLQCENRPVLVHISGDGQPDPKLLPRAREIATNLKPFCDRLSFFVRDHVFHFNGTPEELEPYEQELATLVLESISITSPRFPNDGMIFFSGGTNGRVWRATFRGDRLEDLTFDG